MIKPLNHDKNTNFIMKNKRSKRVRVWARVRFDVACCRLNLDGKKYKGEMSDEQPHRAQLITHNLLHNQNNVIFLFNADDKKLTNLQQETD